MVPELPEVETIRRDLEPLVVGRRIEGVEVDEGTIRLLTGVPIELVRANLTGRVVVSLGAGGSTCSWGWMMGGCWWFICG